MLAGGWWRFAVVASTVFVLSACAGSEATSSPGVSLAPVPASSGPSPVASTTGGQPPSPSPTVGAPPEPTSTKFVLTKETVAKDGYTTTEHYRATWSEPAGAATKFDVYGVTDCLRSSQANDNMPCVVAGTPLPASKLKLIGSAAASKRTLDVSWVLNSEAGPGPYQAVVLFARNSHGSSSPAVLWSALVCFGCVI
jgi:hypothetical protein